jgi:hypothetical protein
LSPFFIVFFICEFFPDFDSFSLPSGDEFDWIDFSGVGGELLSVSSCKFFELFLRMDDFCCGDEAGG